MRIVTCWLFAGAVLLSYMTKPARAQAQRVIFEDEFSENLDNLQKWFSTGWCLDGLLPASWQLVNDGVQVSMLHPTSCALQLTAKQLDTNQLESWQVKFRWQFNDPAVFRSVYPIWQDVNNLYQLTLYEHTLRLTKKVAGKEYQLHTLLASYDFLANTPYDIIITVEKNHHLEVLINDEPVLSVADGAPFISGPTTFSLRAIGQAWKKSITWFDSVEITDLLGASHELLPVPLIKQTDSRWASMLYDRASSWSSQPTMHRWGCALTSMVMVLQYHRILALPSGEPITPLTLNRWLLEQPDGYIGEGLVNWLAITRLTQLVEGKYGPYALEFSLATQSVLSTAQQFLAKKLPVIVQVPGHFVVGVGANTNASDLWINDPFYDEDQLSDRSITAESLRLFTPSHTDLSYLLLVTDAAIEVKVTNNKNQPVASQQVIESISDPVASHSAQTTRKKLTYIAKPTADAYHFFLSGNHYQTTTYHLYRYAQDGGVSIDTQQIDLSNQPYQVVVSLQPDILATPAPTSTPAPTPLLTDTLHQLYDQQQLTNYFTFLSLSNIARWMQQYPTAIDRYKNLLFNRLTELKAFITPMARERLVQYAT